MKLYSEEVWRINSTSTGDKKTDDDLCLSFRRTAQESKVNPARHTVLGKGLMFTSTTYTNNMSIQHCATSSLFTYYLKTLAQHYDLPSCCEVPAWALMPWKDNQKVFVIFFKHVFFFIIISSSSSSLSSPSLCISCFSLLMAVTVLRLSLFASSWILYGIVK